MVLPSLVAVIQSMAIAAFIVGSICLALLGSYRYVETLTRCIYMVPLTRPLPRLAIAPTFAIAMAFVGKGVGTALVRGAAARALSRRNAGKLSWRSVVSSDVKRSEVGYPNFVISATVDGSCARSLLRGFCIVRGPSVLSIFSTPDLSFVYDVLYMWDSGSPNV